jgi:hypothetical protein
MHSRRGMVKELIAAFIVAIIIELAKLAAILLE